MFSGAWRVSSIIAAEQAAGSLLADGTLMQKAATGVANAAIRQLQSHTYGVYGRKIILACGPGNNGADGLYAAVRLLARGASVQAWPVLGEVHDQAWAAFQKAGGKKIDALGAIRALERADLVIDAVLGIGGRPGLPEQAATFAQACHDLDVPVLSVDIPSGVAADCSVELGESFQAATTVTFGGQRLAHVMEPAASRCGHVEVIDIGIALGKPDLRVFTQSDLIAYLPRPDARSDKYSRGVVGVDAGSAIYTGAGVLSAMGAVHAGAGMVRFLGPKPGPVRLALPNVVAAPGRVQAWVLGSGWGGRDGSLAVAQAIAEQVPVVLDADALHPNYLPPVLPPNALLTPHAGELARILGVTRNDVTADPLVYLAKVVDKHQATVLLKGATQYVAGPDFPVTVAIPGPAWTAQAGSGDILAGMCATYLAQGLAPGIAALVAASLQAMAAAQLDGPHPPQVVASEISELIADLVN